MNNGELNGYLMEITGRIFSKVDEMTGKRLIDEILDAARQKGTGMWTSQSAMELHVAIPKIDLAVAMRDLSRLNISGRGSSLCCNGRCSALEATATSSSMPMAPFMPNGRNRERNC
jgi:6-phosphogluconate dehydrogenase